MRGPCAALAAASSSTPSQAQASQISGADRRRVLADAGGEDEAVQPAERRGERADARARRGGRRPRWPSAARGSALASRSRKSTRCRTAPSMPGLAVEQVLDLGRHALAAAAGAAPRRDRARRSACPSAARPAPRSPSSSRRCGPPRMRAERGAVAEMRDHHAPAARSPARPAAGRRRCTRRTGRGSRSGGCPFASERRVARRPARPRAWCGGRRCRSRRPAAGPALPPAPPGSARGCAAGAAARAD